MKTLNEPWGVCEQTGEVTTSGGEDVVCRLNPEFRHDDMVARLNLISAAPDLLEAAEDALRVLGGGNSYDPKWVMRCLRDAIKKAHGTAS